MIQIKKNLKKKKKQVYFALKLDLGFNPWSVAKKQFGKVT